MGFYRIFYIIKSCIKSVLYKLPKKWLIIIIFALAMTFGLTTVKGATYVSVAEGQNENVTFYDYLDLGRNYFDTGITPSYTIDGNNVNGRIVIYYLQSPAHYAETFMFNENTSIPGYTTNSNSSMRMEYQYDTNSAWLRVNSNWSSQYIFGISSNVRHTLNLDFYNRKVDIDNYIFYDFSQYVNSFYSNKTIVLNSNYNYPSDTFRVYGMKVYKDGLNLTDDYYPCEYKYYLDGSLNTTYKGFYNNRTGRILVFSTDSKGSFGSEVFGPNYNMGRPYITTDSSSIVNYTFDTLTINGGQMVSSTQYGSNGFSLVTSYMGIDVSIDIEKYMSNVNGQLYFSIPKSDLIDNPSIQTGRSVNWTLFYYKSVEGGRDIMQCDLGTYTFDLSSNSIDENNAIQQDQTLGAINNLNNSVNETNNFLQDSNVNTSDKTLPTPTIENSEVVSQIDNAYSSFFSDYIYIFASDLPVTISLYIPNMATGDVASTINIPSNYVKSHLTSVNIPFTDYSLLELIYMIWYVVFAFWFLGFATNLVTILFSGEIMDNKGLRELTNTYTGVSKNML